MKNSDDLFQLIKCFDKTEKRFFKLNASKYDGGNGGNPIRLFDAIDAQKKYDEVKLKKKFAGQSIGKNFATEKNLLYRLLIKTFRNYNPEESIELKIRDLLRGAEFLYNKTLYSQCAKMLAKAREIAVAYEKNLLLLEILDLERMLVLVTEDQNDRIKYITEGLPEQKEIIRRMTNTIDYSAFHLKSFDLSKKLGDDTRKPEIMEGLKAMMSDPFLMDEKKAITFEAKHYFYFMKMLYFRTVKDFKNSYIYCLKDVELHESHPEIAVEKVNQYVSALSNSSLLELEQRHFKECLITLEKLKAVHSPNPSITQKISSVYYPRRLAVYMYSGNFSRIHEFVDEVAEFLSENKDNLNPSKVIGIHWNVACCYFGTGAFKEALRWINPVLNDPANEKYGPDMLCYARIFNLIIHFELGNYDLLEHLIRSTNRFIHKKQMGFKLEKIILEFMAVVIESSSDKEREREFIKLKDNVFRLYKQWPDEQGIDYFDFVSWAVSHIQHQSFSETIQSKLKKEGVNAVVL